MVGGFWSLGWGLVWFVFLFFFFVVGVCLGSLLFVWVGWFDLFVSLWGFLLKIPFFFRTNRIERE